MGSPQAGGPGVGAALCSHCPNLCSRLWGQICPHGLGVVGAVSIFPCKEQQEDACSPALFFPGCSTTCSTWARPVLGR